MPQGAVIQVDMENGESFERALSDLLMLKAAYPDEVSSSSETTTFPLRCSLHLSSDSFVELEFIQGYPVTSGLRICSYRSPEKVRMDAVVRAIRETAQECLEDEAEGGFLCCAAALEAWNDTSHQTEEEIHEDLQEPEPPPASTVQWITGGTLVDRKSVFQAHACRVRSEQEVHEALHQLIERNSKLKRCTHNMYAYRLTESLPSGMVKKFDNDDDGEDGAGSRLAQLLEMRGEDGVLVVVSRWYGGIKLGPKRFSHITNVARELLLSCHETHWK